MNKLQKNMLPLNIQLFAENEEEKGNEAENEEGEKETNSENEESKPTFDDVLADKDYQSAFDARITKALQTAKAKWEQEAQENSNEAKKLEKTIK